ncbi:MAG: amino acid adenylation domain-containing protein, partial [bacterium]|nr:amino acid adenylation domain-containing protein [bacterium]
KIRTLRYLLLGAEELTGNLLKRSILSVENDCRVFNMYGPTEATIIASVLEISGPDREKYTVYPGVPIGKPVANTTLLVLDKNMKLCPIGTAGELYIAGAGVAQGYLNNPELTSERFLPPNNQTPITDSNLYKTGDRAAWMTDGNIKFLGRADTQVKIRGHRIEMGEIENTLLKQKEIKESHVTLHKTHTGEDYLCAYIIPLEPETRKDTGDTAGHTPKQTAQRLITKIRDNLLTELPDYMMPAFFIIIDTIPLNPNGKIDTAALPKTGIPGTGETKSQYAPPRDENENKLVSIWTEVLYDKTHRKIGIDDNF